MLKHLALIMDGNRRWARHRALKPWLGHSEGTRAVRHSISFCLKNKIPTLTLYTFSIENFSRTQEELSYFFELLINQISSQTEELIDKKVCIKFVGDREIFPKSTLSSIEDIESSTKDLKELTVYVLFCYGGQQEIVNATKLIAQDILSGKLDINDINTKLLKNYLWVSSEPDLIIRTGGASRLSNFLPYQSAYSELYFTDKLWPDITETDLELATNNFLERKRNFGA